MYVYTICVELYVICYGIIFIVFLLFASLAFSCQLNWSLSRSAAINLKIIHSLQYNSANILEASLISGSTAEKGGKGKHRKKDDACNARGWSC